MSQMSDVDENERGACPVKWRPMSDRKPPPNLTIWAWDGEYVWLTQYAPQTSDWFKHDITHWAHLLWPMPPTNDEETPMT